MCAKRFPIQTLYFLTAAILLLMPWPAVILKLSDWVKPSTNHGHLHNQELQAKASTCTAVPRSGRALLQGSPVAPVRSSNNHRSPGSPWAAMDLMELAPHLTTINRMSPGSEARTILYLIFLIFFYLYIYLYIYKSTTVLPLQRESFFFFSVFYSKAFSN